MVSPIEKNNLIYIQLNRLVDELKKEIIDTTKEENLTKGLLNKIVLLSRGMKLTTENIDESRSFLAGKRVLILDGLDEIYSTLPNIVPAISQFKAENPDSQLIVSSRDCVSYLNEIRFLGITLLPFTQKQLNKFIRGWFNGSENGEDLIEAIKKRNLYEHIKTPLLLTITCSLVEKGINAPSTENEIYSERLSLLTGEYDAHKNIRRQKQKGDLLRACAYKIAYNMHSQGVRSLLKKEILRSLCESFSEKYSKKLMKDCLEELINPCNILLLDPVSSKYSFGHFRFQEHMVSEELRSNRGVSLAERTTYDWWRGVLCLYAQDNDISFLIEDVYKRYGSLKSSLITLKAMIESRPISKRRGLNELLAGYIESDHFDSMIFGGDEYDGHYE